MAAHRVEICGVDTSRLPVLTHQQMMELFPKIHAGDEEARRTFIYGNLRLVLSLIQRFNHRGESADDLFQVGCIGLMKAIDNFDLSQNVRFSTYAVPMIMGEIRRYLRDNNTIRVSRSLRDTAYKVLQAREAWVARTGREPTVDEISHEMGVEREEIVRSLEAIQDPISLFEPVFHDGTDTLSVMDQIRDEQCREEAWLESIALQDAMDHLSDRERRILYLRFFQGRTQMEVAGEIHISQAQVSRLEKSALKRIRRSMD